MTLLSKLIVRNYSDLPLEFKRFLSKGDYPNWNRYNRDVRENILNYYFLLKKENKNANV